MAKLFRTRRGTGERGQTLVELILASTISFVIISATVATYLPQLNTMQAIAASNNSRLGLASPLDTIEIDASSMYAVYVDPTQCYATCMVDGNGNRIYYYWDPNAAGTVKNLYRKKESATNPVSCTGGQVVATGIDTTNSSFSIRGSLLNVQLAAYDPSTQKTLFQSSSIFPLIQERSIIFYEGFECATLRQGWTINQGSGSSWSVVSGAHMGDYQITDTENVQGGSTTTIISPTFNLARTSNPNLQFYYMNSGTIASTDSFTAYYFDGTTWQTVFSDTSGTTLSSMRVVTASLSGYNLSSQAQIKFSGTLQNAGAHWYVDAIQVYQP